MKNKIKLKTTKAQGLAKGNNTDNDYPDPDPN